MATNTTSVTVTIRVNNDDIQGSIAAIKALFDELSKSLNAPPVDVLERK